MGPEDVKGGALRSAWGRGDLRRLCPVSLPRMVISLFILPRSLFRAKPSGLFTHRKERTDVEEFTGREGSAGHYRQAETEGRKPFGGQRRERWAER